MNDEELIKTIKEKDRENDRLMDLLEKSIQVNERINKRYLIRSYVSFNPYFKIENVSTSIPFHISSIFFVFKLVSN